MFLILFGVFTIAHAGPATESFKGQYCTDPRTMNKHAAYTEWADAYSCSRHRCQPGGRNLAIYTVGCKRVEAPESAIECEEVVEDTNMQFPFCCTRLRCLVVVRGEVWTRVLGQPWEALPAAPWSHMYKMKKPPPGTEGTFLPKTPELGPVYELAEGDKEGDKARRASKKTSNNADCSDAVLRAQPSPDIVIALSTNSEKDPKPLVEEDLGLEHGKVRQTNSFVEDERDKDPDAAEAEETDSQSHKQQEASDERFGNSAGVTQKSLKGGSDFNQVGWTEIPQNQWNERDPDLDSENKDVPPPEPSAAPRPKGSNLQALVDAIGSRMKDIESVVQKMTAKVHDKPHDANRIPDESSHKRHKPEKSYIPKRPNAEGNYKRFSIRNRGSKYLHGVESTSDQPLIVEDAATGYYSDGGALLRRNTAPKEQQETYMAPVETRRKAADVLEDDSQKKRRKHKKKKGKHHKKRHGKKKINKFSSESDKNAVVSLEDSSIT